MKSVSASVLTVLAAFAAAGTHSAQAAALPPLHCLDASGTHQLWLSHPDLVHAQGALTGPEGHLSLAGIQHPVQSSALGTLSQYQLNSAQGPQVEVFVSHHHLFNAPQFCGRAGCDPLPQTQPQPQPQPQPDPQPWPHGPHRIAPLQDQGISAQVQVHVPAAPTGVVPTLMLDCFEAQ